MTLGGFTHQNFVQPAPPPPPPPGTPPGQAPAGPPPAPPVVVISYRVWQELFNGDPAIVGKPIHFAEIATTIAGVAPRDFDTPHGGDFWFSQQLGKDDINHFFDGFMRLKPGRDARARQRRDGADHDGLAHDFPAADMNRAYVTRPLVGAGGRRSRADPRSSSCRRPACCCCSRCVNVTNLLLARGAARAREMAVACRHRRRRGRASSGSCSPSRRCCRRAGAVARLRARLARRARAAHARRVEAAAARRRHVRRTRAAVRRWSRSSSAACSSASRRRCGWPAPTCGR